MARLSGVDLPNEKKIEFALQYIYGIGPTVAKQILEKTGVPPSIKVKNLTEKDIVKLRNIIDKEYKIEGELRREVSQNIRRLIEIGSYRGIRHRRGLPAHGQRTKTNARTKKGPRKAVVGKKKAPSKGIKGA